MPRFGDAHIHLADAEFHSSMPHILNSIRFLDMLVVSVSMDLESSEDTLKLHQLLPSNIAPFVGIHPWSVSTDNIEQFESLVTANLPHIRGIGEIGLDKKLAASPKEYQVQRRVFEAMLRLGEMHRLPVSIHSRDSYDDIVETLECYQLRGVVLHWFAGDEKHLRTAVDRGYWLSYGPTTVYSKKSRSLARESPIELILAETDGPVRYGACFQHRAAVPAFIPSVLLALAETKQMGFEEMRAQLESNILKYLNLERMKR